jgi:signal transduction histidine kinase
LIIGVAAALMLPAVVRGAEHDAPTLRAALETTMTLFALAGAWLMRAQFMHSRTLRDLVLLVASTTFGLMNLWISALPAALGLGAGIHLAAADLWGQLGVAVAFVAAAFAPSDRLVTRARYPGFIAAGSSVAAVVIAGVLGLMSSTQMFGTTAHSARMVGGALGHPVALVLVLLASSMLLCSAAAFQRRCRLEAERVAAMLGGAAILLAGATFQHLLPTPSGVGLLSPSDGLRVIASLLVLAAAIRRELQARARIAKAAALAERRRVARDLHDGLAQDLAFIAAHGSRIAVEMGDEHPVVIAARRALAVSRSAIADLSDPAAASAHESLEAVAQELRARFDIAIAIDAQLDDDLGADEQENMTRIAREAIANAARHGGARNVIVSLGSKDEGISLRVIDDGRGIETSGRTPPPEGFGLRSMRERAAALGGHLTVRHGREGGTELEVVLP